MEIKSEHFEKFRDIIKIFGVNNFEALSLIFRLKIMLQHKKFWMWRNFCSAVTKFSPKNFVPAIKNLYVSNFSRHSHGIFDFKFCDMARKNLIPQSPEAQWRNFRLKILCQTAKISWMSRNFWALSRNFRLKLSWQS